MKRILFSLFTFSLVVGSLSAQVEKQISSEIKKVVLFPYEAQEYRTASVQLENGKQVIKLTGLSPYIKKESVRVEADGNFSILNVNYELDYLNITQKSEAVKSLQSKINQVTLQIQDEETELSILKEKIDYFQANRNLGSKENKLNPVDFKTVTDFYMKNMEQIRTESLVHERKAKVYRDSLTAYNCQLYQINNKQVEPSGIITVIATSKTERKASLKFSYIVQRASWVPSYDIRFESLTKPLKLSYKASMQQTTGIDWNNVALSLSTAQTQVSADIPELFPYYLQYVYIQAKPQQISMQASASNIYNALQPQFRKANFVYDMSPDYLQKQAQQATSFTFDVDGLQTIKSEGKQNLLRFKDADVPCTYIYKTIPKLSDKVYLIGRITNWFDMGIQNGDLNLYFENAFIGTSTINTEQFSDTLDVSFGVDQGISVKRDKIKEFTSTKFLGDSKKESIAWRIVLKNNKNEAVKVKVLDQVPITKNEDFKVDVVTLTGGVKNETSGEVEWNIDLAPKESKELILQYTVKYPKGMNLVTD